MNKKLKTLSVWGLMLVCSLFVLGLLGVATQSPAAAIGSLWIGIGLAVAVGSDSVSNLRTLRYTHNAALVPGNPIVYNGGVIVACNTTAANAENVFIYKGKMTFPKEADLAVNQFDLVYWNASTNVITKTAGGNTACGYCVEKALAADTTVTIMLRPTADITTAVEAVEQSITDPGASGAIPVTHSGVCAITSAGAETRTLAIPGKIGQIIALSMDVDGGDCVITVAAAINQTGNNTITLNDAGDTIVLIAVQKAAGLVWRVLVNDGATLSTV